MHVNTTLSTLNPYGSILQLAWEAPLQYCRGHFELIHFSAHA